MTLDLSIDCFHGFDFDDIKHDLTHEDVLSTIFAEESGQIASVRIEDVARGMPNALMSSQLEGLRKKCPQRFVLTNAPRLRKVDLVGVSANAIIILPWTRITHTSRYPTLPLTSP